MAVMFMNRLVFIFLLLPFLLSCGGTTATVSSTATILTVQPSEGAAHISTTTLILAVFDQDMDGTSFDENSFVLTDPAQNEIAGAITYSDKIATFTPSANLGYATLYTATIKNTVKDTGGMNLSGNTSWSFTTIAEGETPQITTPVFSIPGGTYSSSQSVSIDCSEPGAEIRYTVNSDEPTPTIGTLYSTPVNISQTTTLKAIASKTGMTDSPVASATYTISGSQTQVSTPVFHPSEGTYSSYQSVTITSDDGAEIRYTTDGTAPTPTTGTIYSSPINTSLTTTIKAIASKAGLTDSSIASATYTINDPWTVVSAFSVAPINCDIPCPVDCDISCSGDTSDTTNHVDILENPGSNCIDVAGGKDDFWVFVPTLSGTVNIKLTDTSTDNLSVFLTYANWNESGYLCSSLLGSNDFFVGCDSWGIMSAAPNIDAYVLKDTYYFVIIDAENGTEAGPYTFEITYQ